MNNVRETEYQSNEYVVKAVAPNILFLLKSMIPAINWAVAPKNNVQGIIRDVADADANPRSVDASTNAAIARPISPKEAGSAAITGSSLTLISSEECCSMKKAVRTTNIYV